MTTPRSARSVRIAPPEGPLSASAIRPTPSARSRHFRLDLEKAMRSPGAESVDTVALIDPMAAPMDLERMKTNTDFLVVEFQEGDRGDPANFSKMKKWAITLTGCYLTLLVTAASSSYASGFPSMGRDLHTTPFLEAVGLSVYAFGFGVVPILIAPLSEETGRRPLFVGASFVLVGAHIMIAVARNIATVIVGRFFIGCAGSLAAMVGGSIADIWATHERGVPLAIFAFSAIGGTGIGPVGAGWIETNKHLQWRWIQWFHVIAAGILVILVFFFMVETRASVLLIRRAKKIRKETGDSRFMSRAELETPDLRTLLYISCTRTLRLLFTEPIVASISGWIGLAWGILFGLIGSITPAFKTLHGFNTGQVGTIYLSLVLGAALGLLANFHQEYLYHKNVGKRGPEARLYWPMISALLFPAGMLIYAFTSYSHVPWIAMCVGLALFMWATYQIFLASYSYLVDCYGPYASSAIAGQNLFRNTMATVFPLFVSKYFKALDYHWGNALLGFVALLMAPIPFVLFKYGPRIRTASPISQRLMREMK